eukprot:403370780
MSKVQELKQTDKTQPPPLAEQKKQQQEFLFGHYFTPGGPLPENLEPNQLTAKYYLEQNLFPNLEKAMNVLLETIEQNGEFEKYVEMLAERQEKEQRDLRRRERDRRKLQLGDEYETSGSEGDEDGDSDDDDEDSDEDEYDEEEAESNNNYTVEDMDQSSQSQYNPDATLNSQKNSTINANPMKGKKSISPSKKQQEQDLLINIEDQFNPLRFLAITLKDLCEQKKSL